MVFQQNHIVHRNSTPHGVYKYIISNNNISTRWPTCLTPSIPLTHANTYTPFQAPSVIKRPIRFSDRINEPRRLIRDPWALKTPNPKYKRTYCMYCVS